MLIPQNEDGGWPKNVGWFIKLNTTNIEEVRTNIILNGEGGGKSTFDNRTIYSHIDYLANVYSQIPNEKYKSAIEKAINWIFTIQNNISHGFTGIDVDAVTYIDFFILLKLTKNYDSVFKI